MNDKLPRISTKDWRYTTIRLNITRKWCFIRNQCPISMPKVQVFLSNLWKDKSVSCVNFPLYAWISLLEIQSYLSESHGRRQTNFLSNKVFLWDKTGIFYLNMHIECVNKYPFVFIKKEQIMLHSMKYVIFCIVKYLLYNLFYRLNISRFS